MSGAERIARAFAACAQRERGALIPFLSAGDPDFAGTQRIAVAAAASADLIEIGFPFSDSVADGPVIQASYTRALGNGATIEGALDCCRAIASETDVPIVVMCALNLVLARGPERFCADLARAGVCGLLIPDLLADDAALVAGDAARHGLGTVFLAGPGTSADRLRVIAEASTGFIYVVRRGGVTGAGGGDHDLAPRIAALRAITHRPLAVGFGVSTREDVALVARHADGVIVGSALVDAAHRAGANAPAAAASLLQRLAPPAR